MHLFLLCPETPLKWFLKNTKDINPQGQRECWEEITEFGLFRCGDCMWGFTYSDVGWQPVPSPLFVGLDQALCSVTGLYWCALAPTLTSPLQHRAGNPSQSSQAGKKIIIIEDIQTGKKEVLQIIWSYKDKILDSPPPKKKTLLILINDFSKVMGYKINIQKCVSVH